MNLKSSDYGTLVTNIRKNNSRIIIYGAGMIGQIIIPYLVDAYNLYDHIECYVDTDKRKQGKRITIGSNQYDIRSPEILHHIPSDTVILVTNSKFYPIIAFLDNIKALADTDCYIIPMMQLSEPKPTIPKTIHYCWFGGKKIPDFLENCIESWKKQCPEYEIIRWDETNYDVSKYTFTRQAFQSGKFGFVTDIARLDILYRYGGIYMDTDVKLLKPLDKLLYHKGFIGVEKWGNINTGGGVGAISHHPMIREMLDYRLEFPFVFDDGSLNVETNGLYETIPFVRHGMRIDNTLQTINDMTVYPSNIFHPYDYMSCEENIDEDTVSIHYFYGGWMEEDDKKNRSLTRDKYQAVKRRIQETLQQEVST